MQSLLRILAFFLLSSIALIAVSATPTSGSYSESGFTRRSIVPRFGTNSRTISSHVVPRTNAERLANGMSPLKPRQLFSPSRVRRQIPSATPGGMYSGIIQVVDKGGLPRGYLQPASGRIVSTIAQATTFSYTQPADGFTPVEMVTMVNTRLAAGSTSGMPSILSPSSANSARILEFTSSVPSGNIPARMSTTSAAYGETTIFTVDPITRLIGVKWVNYDGSTPAITLFQQGAYAYITGSPSKFTSIASGSLEVDFVFIPNLQ